MRELFAFNMKFALVCQSSRGKRDRHLHLEARVLLMLRLRLRWWGSQVEFVEKFERGVSLSQDSVARENDLLGEDTISLASSGSADNALLALSQTEEQAMAI